MQSATSPVLSRERTVATPGWNRWLVPPAALSIHLAIGGVYGWSVFKLPLEETLGISGLVSSLPFAFGIVVLGLSAAIFGKAVDHRGPRWAMSVATVCFVTGLLVSAFGAAVGQAWIIVLGYGVIGGVGLGIGYISPVSTLMKWFPDRPGMATGFAIMGFGGGALIASPGATALMNIYGTDQAGLALTFMTIGIICAVFMSLGVALIRVPPEGWTPNGRVQSAGTSGTAEQTKGPDRTVSQAVRTRQFWLLWVVLCFNVTAGIGILERAAPIYSDYFSNGISAEAIAAAAAGFVAVISLANALGRIFWSSVSDIVGRKNIYRLYLGAGAALYGLIVLLQDTSQILFLLASILILSFYGAGFATVPAYLRDLFGTYQVGAIHGRLLTAWSLAGVLGPVIVNAIADNRIEAGIEGPERYQLSFIIMTVLLVIAFICNELITTPAPPDDTPVEPSSAGQDAAARNGTEQPVHQKEHTDDDADDIDRAMGAEEESPAHGERQLGMLTLFAWLWVAVPFGYGVLQLAVQVPDLVSA